MPLLRVPRPRARNSASTAAASGSCAGSGRLLNSVPSPARPAMLQNSSMPSPSPPTSCSPRPCAAHRAQDARRIRAIAADVEHADLGIAQPPRQPVVVVRARRVDGVDRFADALRPQPQAGLLREAAAIGAAVVDDRDLPARPAAREEVAGEPALVVIAASQPEDVAPTLLGQAQMGRARRDHQDVRGLVDCRSEQRGVRAHVADHDADVGRDELARGRHRGLQTAAVVDRDQGQRLAAHAARLVEVTHRQLERDAIALARPRVGTAERAGEADPDLRLRDTARQHQRAGDQAE